MIRQIVEGLKELSASSDPFEICDYLDIKVIEEYLGDEILGYYQKTESGFEILHINNTLDYNYKKYICAHELGHAILEPDLSISFFIENPLMLRSKSELRADRFAAELIIGNDIMTKAEYEGLSIEQIASIENISVDLLKLKFKIR